MLDHSLLFLIYKLISTTLPSKDLALDFFYPNQIALYAWGNNKLNTPVAGLDFQSAPHKTTILKWQQWKENITEHQGQGGEAALRSFCDVGAQSGLTPVNSTHFCNRDFLKLFTTGRQQGQVSWCCSVFNLSFWLKLYSTCMNFWTFWAPETSRHSCYTQLRHKMLSIKWKESFRVKLQSFQSFSPCSATMAIWWFSTDDLSQSRQCKC